MMTMLLMYTTYLQSAVPLDRLPNFSGMLLLAARRRKDGIVQKTAQDVLDTGYAATFPPRSTSGDSNVI